VGEPAQPVEVTEELVGPVYQMRDDFGHNVDFLKEPREATTPGSGRRGDLARAPSPTRTFVLGSETYMSDDSPTIPLADVLRAANELVSAGLIEDYALGGALAAIYYVEPFTTYDADIFFVAKDKTLSAGIPAIYSHLQSKGWRVEREHLLVNGFPVQFLAASGLTEEAVRDARQIEYEGVPAKVFRPEYIIAIAASVGRHKDLARIDQMFEQAEIEKTLLDDILARYNLSLPKP
jgi:hypothetical protein